MYWSLAIPRCATEIIRLVASHALNMCFSIHTSDHCPGLIICMGFSGDRWSSPICQEIDPFKDVWSGDDYLGLMIGDRCGDRNYIDCWGQKNRWMRNSQKRSMSISTNDIRSGVGPVS
jgi:hypothetical protein